jgi:hypothetical protein
MARGLSDSEHERTPSPTGSRPSAQPIVSHQPLTVKVNRSESAGRTHLVPKTTLSKAHRERVELLNAPPAEFFSIIRQKFNAAKDLDGADETQGISKDDLLQTFTDLFKDKAIAYGKKWRPSDYEAKDAPI